MYFRDLHPGQRLEPPARLLRHIALHLQQRQRGEHPSGRDLGPLHQIVGQERPLLQGHQHVALIVGQRLRVRT